VGKTTPFYFSWSKSDRSALCRHSFIFRKAASRLALPELVKLEEVAMSAVLTATTKVPALLVRHLDKRPVLAKLQTQDQTLHVVEVRVKGGYKYALGEKQAVGYRWVINPTDKVALWNSMRERWNITVSGS
jgi:hypothetical protein